MCSLAFAFCCVFLFHRLPQQFVVALLLVYFSHSPVALFLTSLTPTALLSNVVGPTRGLAASRGDGGVSSAFLVYEYDVMGRPQLLTNQPNLILFLQ